MTDHPPTTSSTIPPHYEHVHEAADGTITRRWAGAAERAWWAAFDYDHDRDRWLLAERVSPMDVLDLAAAKLDADHSAVAEVLSAIDQPGDDQETS